MRLNDISEYVDRNKNEAIQCLIEILQTPSPTGEEYAISELIKKKLEEEKLPVDVYALDIKRPNIISNWVGNTKGKTFLLNGHYDVFPPDSQNAKDAWSAKIVGDDIYACGSADMKTGVTAALMAIKFLKRSGFVPNGKIIFNCNADEEQGGKYGVCYLLSKGLLSADFGICMEASQDSVIVDSDGRIAYQVTYKEESWHAGLRKNQKSAIQKAHLAIERLNEYDKYLHRERTFEDSSTGAILSITELKAGDLGKTPNVHAPYCTFTIDRRYTNGETIESATKELISILDDLKLNNASMNYELKTLTASPQLKMDAHSSVIDCSIEAYKKFFKKEITTNRRCGGGDTAKITDAYHFPLPQFGPGKFDQLCAKDEHVSLSEYINFIKAYMYIIIKMLG